MRELGGHKNSHFKDHRNNYIRKMEDTAENRRVNKKSLSIAQIHKITAPVQLSYLYAMLQTKARRCGKEALNRSRSEIRLRMSGVR